MLLNTKDIPEGRSKIDQQVAMTQEQKREVEFIGDVFCHAEINRNNFQIFIALFYKGTVLQECARCLSPYSHSVDGTFKLILVKSGKNKKSSNFQHKTEYEPYDYIFDDYNSIIDIRQSIYEEVMINLPLKPLCSVGCKGIQYRQGTRSQSEMDKKEIDPRWEALKKIINVKK